MQNKILKLIVICLISFSLFSCKQSSESPTFATELDLPQNNDKTSYILTETRDMGTEYIDSIIFFGESTTAHMKSRGVLSGGKATTQVWAPKNGTVNLDSTISNVKIVYPETGEHITIKEAVAAKKPKIMILTFGLNGAVSKIKHGEQSFREDYITLIDEIKSGSPDTKIILQSCFPISRSMDMSNFSIDAHILNEYIKTINSWTQNIAYNQGLYYLDTSEVLSTDEGYLRREFDNGDGHHLNKDAYITIIHYIRTHGIKE